MSARQEAEEESGLAVQAHAELPNVLLRLGPNRGGDGRGEVGHLTVGVRRVLLGKIK